MNAHQDIEQRRAGFIANKAADGDYREPHRGSDASRRMRAGWRRAKSMIARMRRAPPRGYRNVEFVGFKEGVSQYDAANDVREHVAEVIRFPTTNQRRKSAYDLYVKAHAIDEHSPSEAEALYQRAIALDPELAMAHTNLGNLVYRRGRVTEAIQLYKHALSLNDGQPEAHYNIGYLEAERGHHDAAVRCFQRAIKLDPRFADAHYNLGAAYEELGKYDLARPCWETYLKLESAGDWADAARSRLNRRRS